MPLSKETRDHIDALHYDSVQRALAAEIIGNVLIGDAVLDVNRKVAMEAALGGDHRSAMRAIRSSVNAIGSGAADAARLARQHARNLARQQVSEELAASFGMVQAVYGTAPPPPAVGDEDPELRDQDNAHAEQVGAAVSARWAALALLALNRWRARGGDRGELASTIQSIEPAIAPRVSLAAQVSAFDSYASEHQFRWQRIAAQVGAYRTAGEGVMPASQPLPAIPFPLVEPSDIFPSGPEQGLPYGWASGFMDVWSAILDRKTCPVCFEADGQMVPVGKQFPGFGRPLVHNFCRCVVVATFIPEAAAKRVPGLQIDYSELKADVRDYMRQAGSMKLGTGRRHALDYATSVLGERVNGGIVAPRTTSPQKLTEKIRERRHYFPDRTRPKAPPLEPLVSRKP